MHHFALIPLVKLIGYPGLFAVVFFESGVFFGFFLPGASMLFAAGLLASQGFFSIWALLALIVVAAVLGDSTGYWFGAHVGVRLFLREDSRFFRHEYLQQAKDFYDTHGVVAVFLARFIPVIRTFAPIVAGIVKMRYRTFLMYNIAGAFVWGAGVTFGGYFLGQRFPFISLYLTPIVLLIVAVTLIPIFWKLYRESGAKN